MRSRKSFDEWMAQKTCSRPDCDSPRADGSLLCPFHTRMERQLIDMAKRPDEARSLYDQARVAVPLKEDNNKTHS